MCWEPDQSELKTNHSNYHQHHKQAVPENTQNLHTQRHAYLTDQFKIHNNDLGWQGLCNMPEGGMRHRLSCLTR